MSIYVEPLPDDGAPYKCGFKVPYDRERQSGTCDQRATQGLTEQYWATHRHLYATRAFCSKHSPKE